MPEPMDFDDPKAPWNWNPVDRKAAETELKCVVRLFLCDDDEVMTYEELADAVSSEAATIPDEDAGWIGGEFDCDDYITDACLVGIYQQIEAVTSIVTDYTDGTRRWTHDQLRTGVFPEQRRGDESFEEWLSASVRAGQFRTVDFLQYIGQSDDDDEVDGSVVLERRIVD